MTKTIETPPQGVVARLGWTDWLFILATPLAAWWILRISFFVQLGYLDPWIYTGVGQIFEKLVDVYGWPYYFVRFPVTFVNRVFCLNGAPEAGFLLLRYCLVLGSGGALYTMALRQFGRVAAMTGYLFLFCNPLFLRVIIWDLTPFLSVPAALAGAAVWLYAERVVFWRYALAGALFCVSVNSHVFTATAIGCFLLGVGAAHLVARRPLGQLAAQLALAAGGFVVLWLAGWVYYVGLVGSPVDTLLFWKVNASTLAAGRAYAVEHARPFAAWAAWETYFYVPFLWLAASLLLPRSPQPGSRHSYWVIVLASCAYSAFFLIYRFVLGRFVVEEFYYFGHIWAVFPLLVPLVVALAENCVPSRLGLVAVFATVTVPLSFLVVLQNRGSINWFTPVHGSGFALAIIFLGAIAGLVAMRLRAGRKIVPFAGFALFCTGMQILSILPWSSRQVYGAPIQVEQRQLFSVVVQYTHLWAKYAGKDRAPLVWYRGSATDYDISSMCSAAMGDTLHYRWDLGGMPVIGQLEQQRLAEGGRHHIFLISKDRAEIDRGKAALAAAGVVFSSLEQAKVSAGSLLIFIEIVQFTKRPST